MKNLMKPAVAVLACLFLFATTQAIQSEEKGKTEAKKDAKADAKKDAKAEKKDAKKAARSEEKKETPKVESKKVITKDAGKRLPRYYGQLNLNEEQKQKIYAIQDKYEPQIAELQKKLSELRRKQGDESLTVLNDEQKSLLKEKIAAATGNRDSSKAAKGSTSGLKSKSVGKKISEKVTESKKSEK